MAYVYTTYIRKAETISRQALSSDASARTCSDQIIGPRSQKSNSQRYPVVSPEEQQVVYDEWLRILNDVTEELRDCAQVTTDNEVADHLHEHANVIAKICVDIGRLRWTDEDVNAARSLVAGYVSQTNAERQARRDADLERHKLMVAKERGEPYRGRGSRTPRSAPVQPRKRPSRTPKTHVKRALVLKERSMPA